MPNISIIIPNYNHARFLSERINSVLNQSYKNFELIILDDCSTDNSREIIDQYRSNPHVTHIIYNETNSGSPFVQWKKGIELAKGKFIWIAESDDYVDSTFLDEVVSRFNVDDKVGIVYCDSNVINNEEVIYDFYKGYRNRSFNTLRWNQDFINDGRNEIKDYLFYENTINNTSAMVFKKDLISTDTFKDLHYFKYSGDWYFFLKIAYGCKISYINKALNYFRSGPDNFKKGVKSPLNYFRERTLVRYLAIENTEFDKVTLSKVMGKLGPELKYQIFDLVKGKINIKDFYIVCRQLLAINQGLFFKQIRNIIN